jgi:hypothetical protein
LVAPSHPALCFCREFLAAACAACAAAAASTPPCNGRNSQAVTTNMFVQHRVQQAKHGVQVHCSSSIATSTARRYSTCLWCIFTATWQKPWMSSIADNCVHFSGHIHEYTLCTVVLHLYGTANYVCWSAHIFVVSHVCYSA